MDVLDRNQLRDITLNDRDMTREIVSALLEHTSQQIHRLAEAVRSEDLTGCMRMAHSSKGACATVGANRAAELFRQFERNAAEGSIEKCREILAPLESEFELLRAEGSKVLSSPAV